MATAALTVDLNARIAQFETEMKRATGSLDRFEKKSNQLASSLKNAFGGLAGTFTVGLALRKFINETVDAQNEQAQLAAVIKSTGAAAGYTADQLNKMASELAGRSVFSDGEINKAQIRLLSYTGIVGEQVPKAMQAVIDMSSRMGMSLEQSAETIGRSLDIPSQGLTALQRQGFRFTDAQKKVVEELEKTGRVAEAQKIVLDALESSYGGAAKAARETFGGALKALQNEFDSLVTGTDTASKRLTEVTDGLTTTAKRVRELLDDGQGLPALVRAFAGLGKAPWDLIFGDINIASTADERLEELRSELNGLETDLRKSEAGGSRSSVLLRKLFGTPEELEQKVTIIKNQIATLEKFGGSVYKPRPSGPPVGSPSKDLPTPSDTKKADPQGAFVAKLKQEAETLGLSGEALQRYEAIKLKLTGSNAKLAESYIAQIAAFKKAAGDQEFMNLVMQDGQNTINEANQNMRDWEETVKSASQELTDMVSPVNVLIRQLTELDKFDGFIDPEILAAARLELNAQIDGLGQVDDKLKETKSLAEEIGLSFTSAFEDAVAGGESFSNVLKALERDLIKLATRKAVTEPLMKAIDGIDFGSLFSGITANAKGGIYNSPSLSAYSGSVVNSPTLFKFASGAGLMGEAGAEAILPLKRGPNGKLGVEGGMGGGVQVNVINNAGGTQASTKERQENGVRVIDVMVEQVEGAIGRRMSRGEGLAPTMERRYGLNPSAGAMR